MSKILITYISVSLSLHHPVLVKTVISDSGTPAAVLQREVEGVPLGSSADGRPGHRARARVTLWMVTLNADHYVRWYSTTSSSHCPLLLVLIGNSLTTSSSSFTRSLILTFPAICCGSYVEIAYFLYQEYLSLLETLSVWHVVPFFLRESVTNSVTTYYSRNNALYTECWQLRLNSNQSYCLASVQNSTWLNAIGLFMQWNHCLLALSLFCLPNPYLYFMFTSYGSGSNPLLKECIQVLHVVCMWLINVPFFL